METVISPSRRGFTGIERRDASFSAHSESHSRSSSQGVLRKSAGVLLQVDADAAEEDFVLG